MGGRTKIIYNGNQEEEVEGRRNLQASEEDSQAEREVDRRNQARLGAVKVTK